MSTFKVHHDENILEAIQSDGHGSQHNVSPRPSGTTVRLHCPSENNIFTEESAI
jgi:hypothetical protein